MKNDEIRPDGADLKLGWSDFAAKRHVKNGKHSWFDGSSSELLALVRAGWDDRWPGDGRHDLTQVVLVPVDPSGFVSSTVKVDETTPLHAVYDRRQSHEEGFIRVTAEGPREKVAHAAVVMYSAGTLLENGGERSGDYDWEVVCLIAGPEVKEPMDPLTMARNMLEKPGGTYCSYTAAEFARSIWYWSDRATAHQPEAGD